MPRSIRIPWLVVGALGLLAGDLVSPSQIPLPILGAITLLGAAAFTPTRSALTRRIGLALLAFGLGYSNADRVYHPVLPVGHVGNLALPASVRLEGVLAAEPETRADQVRLVIAVTRGEADDGWQPMQGLISLSLHQAGQPWATGDQFEATLGLRRPRNFGNPGEFDYEAYLARQGIYVTAFAYDDGEFRRAPSNGWLIAWMNRWRAATRAVYRAALPLADAQLLDALILGSQRELPIELQNAFRRTGTSHILAISGMNVGVVAGAAYFLFRWLLARSQRLLLLGNVHKLSTSLTIIPVVLYAGIAGTNVATLRALLMLVVLLGAVLVERQQRTTVSLAASATMILLLWPGSGRDISFELSFAAVAGLIVGMERFSRWWRDRARERLLHLRGWRGPAENAVAMFAAVSATAMAATTPLVAFHFNQVSLVAPLANAVAVPLLGSAAIGLGLLSALTCLISQPIAELFARLAWPTLAAGRAAVTFFSALPYASINVVSLTPYELALIYFAMGSFFCRPIAARRGLRTLIFLLLTIDAACWWQSRYHRQDLSVTFLSVGQGDCAVVELPGHEVMVVDGGGMSSRTFDVGERIIAPFLWSRKIARIDYIVLSHPQWDHYGGLRYLAEQFQPREFWWNGKNTDAITFRQLLAALSSAGTRSLPMKRGATRQLGEVEAKVLAPDRIEDVTLNDSSLVLSLGYHGQQILFTGDIEHEAERDLVRTLGVELQSAVLKVPHHGSITSSTQRFLEAVHPQFAVMSLGFANRFGFPSAKVTRRYTAIGTHTFRTDADGAVQACVSTEGAVTIELRDRG